MRPAIIILSFNSEMTLGATLSRARMVTDEIFVVDSYSKDSTLEIAKSFDAKIFQHSFEHYGVQRNWAIDNLPITRPWQLHLDADELMDDHLIAAIREIEEDSANNGYLVARYVKFLGHIMRHGGMSPTWHLRLFRSKTGRCEERKYDQHFLLLSGSSQRLRGALIDDIQMSLSEWTSRHNRWADAEVEEMDNQTTNARIRPALFGSPPEQKRFFRKAYNNLPLFVRPFMLFVYRYVFRLGVLDGTAGLIFWILQTFWFRFLIDAKLWEKRNALAGRANSPS